MKNVEKEIGGKLLTLETGKIARQSAGSVVLTAGSVVLIDKRPSDTITCSAAMSCTAVGSQP